jgi:transcriptional regulator with XRE-family HTH domain
MKERIFEFLRAENKSSSQFAEEIGVQPSGVSHILSGRNNPSLDFVLKMLEKYRYLSTEWLLFGKGSMYKDDSGMKSLFDQDLQGPVIKNESSSAAENECS